jgi:uncharacterized protein YbbC (DUF1343 family)
MSLIKNRKPIERKRALSMLLGLSGLFFFLRGSIFLYGADSIDPQRTRLGNEAFIEHVPSPLHGKKLGLVLNQTSMLPDGESLLEALQRIGLHVRAVFTPEHGFKGKTEGGEDIHDSHLEDIKLFSLYGETKKPTPEQMQEVDAFVYDIQDVGTRYYTYITTLKYVMEAAAEAGKAVYVLDRPNPAGGTMVEGPLLEPAYESFIGALPIPVRYGLTAGELASMMKGEGWVPSKVDLHVVRLKNWRRDFFWEDTGLDWIPTSPNIPFPDTAIIYPGTGLLGALTINQGLGTQNPFLQFGAPWMDTDRIIRLFEGGEKYGVELEPLDYTPRSIPGKTLHPPYENRLCRGIRIRLLHRERFPSLHFTIDLIRALKDIHPGDIRLHNDSLNRMFGNNLLERYILDKLSYEALLQEITKDEKDFLDRRKKYLLYN